MKIEEVPQDEAKAFEKQYNVLQYAVDENGKYTAVKSIGWEPKNAVMEHAWEVENEKIAKARTLVKASKKSPIYYHMHKSLMTIGLLSEYTGLSRFRIWRHFKPAVFEKIPNTLLDKYLYAFGMERTDQLFNVED